MTAAIPLSARTVSQLDETLHVPSFPLDARRVGIVHFGVGGFHRAHQALYLDRLFTAGHTVDWAVCGVGMLPGDVRMREALVSQDGLYTLISTAPDGTRDSRIVGSIAEYLYAPEDPEAVLARMTEEQVRIISLTVTEGGYNYNPTTGEFRADTPTVARDLARGDQEHPETLFGFIVEALRRRRAAGRTPFTVLSCDNIRGNGDLARRMILAFAELRDAELGGWVREHVAFPNSMVDRITPATTEADRAMVAEEFGVEDAWPVISEDFLQWVLEDQFPAGRPAFEEVGVQMVDDVEPYELMKLRLLNCSHQAIAYFGLLLGHTYVHEACRDQVLIRFARELYMDREGTPTLPEVPGVDLEEYKDRLVARFDNEHVSDTLARLAAEASDRIPTWMVPVIRENLAAGRDVSACAAVVASWARYAEGHGENGEQWPVADRLQGRLMAAAARHDEDPLAFVRDEELFGDLAEQRAFITPYVQALTTLREQGARALLLRLVDA